MSGLELSQNAQDNLKRLIFDFVEEIKHELEIIGADSFSFDMTADRKGAEAHYEVKKDCQKSFKWGDRK